MEEDGGGWEHGSVCVCVYRERENWAKSLNLLLNNKIIHEPHCYELS